MQMLYYYSKKKGFLKIFLIKSWKITKKIGRNFAKSAVI